MGTVTHLSVAIATALVLPSCAAAPRSRAAIGSASAAAADAADITPRWLTVLEPPGGAGGLAGAHRVAARLFVFADSQLHYLFGKRTFVESPFADRMSFEVAIRPAALNDGGDLLLSLFLEQWKRRFGRHSLVFLGDACDLSCTQEFAAFAGQLGAAGIHHLLVATSNHDGFFAGNFTSRRDLNGQLQLTDMPRDWTRACALPGSFADQRLTKGRATARLAALLPPGPPWATSLATGSTRPEAYRDAHLYYLRRLGGGDVDSPPVWGVFVDTVDYRGFDLESSAGAGQVGAISHQQLRFLDRAMFEANLAAPEEAIFILFGHHPVTALADESRQRLLHFADVHPAVIAYVSAHLHESMERRISLPSGRTLPELVVGSTTDAPQSARLVEVQVSNDGHKRAVASHRLVLDPAAGCGEVPRKHATTLGYTGYRILRDDTPNLEVGSLDKLLVGLGWSELVQQRIVQGLGALLVENELVRSWAKLYLEAPLELERDASAALTTIVGRRYAAGQTLAEVTPWLTGRARGPAATPFQAWHDPAVSPILAVAERGVHRFAAHVDLFARLRAQRGKTSAIGRYFLCHAVYAAQAEAKRSKRSDHVYVIR